MKEIKAGLEWVLPGEIEGRSMEIITQELGSRVPSPENEGVVKRVIHATADFDYWENLCFSPHAVEKGVAALRAGAWIITDTNMVKAGINKAALAQLGGQADCYMAQEEVAAEALREHTTRAVASMNQAARLARSRPELPLIFALGNAPTALARLWELTQEGALTPALIIGVPVGFVNVVESKELILQSELTYIVAKGRKGGSNVAAAICNALLYTATGRKLSGR